MTFSVLTSKTIVIGVVCILCIVIGLCIVYYSFLRIVVPAQQTVVRDVEVTSTTVELSVDFVSSGLWYRGHRTRFSDDALYLEILGTNISFLGASLPAHISIKRTSSMNIKTIYVRGAAEEYLPVWKNKQQ